MERLIVIGGIAAGMSAASKARRTNPELEVVVFERSPYISYGECGLPYYIGEIIKDKNSLFILSTEDAREKRGLDVRTLHEVLRINPEQKEVAVLDIENKREFSLGYDRLVIATGARSVRLNLPGRELDNIFNLRFFDDAENLKNYLDREKPKRGVIIGAGFIGIELAENLRERGIEVTVIEMLPTVLGSTEEELHQLIVSELAAKKVQVLLNTAVKGFRGDTVVRAALTQESEVETDFVIESVGIKAETELARAAGIKIGRSGGIEVDNHMRTSCPDVYAAGDCVEVKHIVSGKQVFVPLALNANRGGRFAGTNVAFAPEREPLSFPGTLATSAVKVFDLEVGKTGLSSTEARVAGFEPVTATIKSKTKAGYWPEHPTITVTLIGDKKSSRLLGCQLAGGDGAVLRINTAATALHAGLTPEQIKDMDLAYAPPFGPSWDPILVAADILAKKLS